MDKVVKAIRNQYYHEVEINTRLEQACRIVIDFHNLKINVKDLDTPKRVEEQIKDHLNGLGETYLSFKENRSMIQEFRGQSGQRLDIALRYAICHARAFIARCVKEDNDQWIKNHYAFIFNGYQHFFNPLKLNVYSTVLREANKVHRINKGRINYKPLGAL